MGKVRLTLPDGILKTETMNPMNPINPINPVNPINPDLTPSPAVLDLDGLT